MGDGFHFFRAVILFGYDQRCQFHVGGFASFRNESFYHFQVAAQLFVPFRGKAFQVNVIRVHDTCQIFGDFHRKVPIGDHYVFLPVAVNQLAGVADKFPA